MTNAIKGALLSGLVYPGLGQVVLKHYKRGILLIMTVSAGLLVMVVVAARQAITILEKIELEGGMIDIDAIANAATQASSPSSGLTIQIFSLLIMIAWIYGIVDAYRIGKGKDLDKKLRSDAQGRTQ